MSEDLKDHFDDLPDDIHNEATLIHGYLDSSDIVTTAQTIASDVVQSLEARNAPMDKREPSQYDVYTLLDGAFVTVAEQFPKTHDPLVALLGALREHPGTNKFDRQFIFAIDERRLRYGDPPSDDFQQDARDDWTNLNRFFGSDSQSECPESLVLCRVSDNIVAAEGHVPAAAHWITICGETLYSDCSEAKDKWVEWESNLEWLVAQDHRHEATKALCQRALTEMQKIGAESSASIPVDESSGEGRRFKLPVGKVDSALPAGYKPTKIAIVKRDASSVNYAEDQVIMTTPPFSTLQRNRVGAN
ncbi:hypothetical protein H0H93_010373, partial [Arthromyces matolae]